MFAEELQLLCNLPFLNAQILQNIIAIYSSEFVPYPRSKATHKKYGRTIKPYKGTTVIHNPLLNTRFLLWVALFGQVDSHEY